MDRWFVISCGAIVAIAAIWTTQSSQPQPLASPATDLPCAEPRRLILSESDARPLRSTDTGGIVAVAFPFFAKEIPDSSKEACPLLDPAAITPSLAAPKQPNINLPSATAEPSPIERVPTTSGETTPLPHSDMAFTQPSQPAVPTLPPRPVPLAAAVSRAEQMTADGINLVERGAIYSARSQFFHALRQIATAQDEIHATTRFTQALHAGLKAIEESHDFDIQYATNSDAVDVVRLVSVHRTDILKQEDLTGMRPDAARDRYQLFAVEQIAAAVDGESAASMPMYGLGRISAASSKANASSDTTREIDALVWYHAALMTNAKNFPAAHELGSLYAKRGELQRAKAVLQRAIAIQSHPITWANLANIHKRLGENDWAAAAEARSTGARQIANSSKLPPIQWVDDATFAKTTGPNEAYLSQQVKQTAADKSAANAEPRSAAKPTAASWLPWGSGHRR